MQSGCFQKDVSGIDVQYDFFFQSNTPLNEGQVIIAVCICVTHLGEKWDTNNEK